MTPAPLQLTGAAITASVVEECVSLGAAYLPTHGTPDSAERVLHVCTGFMTAAIAFAGE